jgi:hypothetical protein
MGASCVKKETALTAKDAKNAKKKKKGFSFHKQQRIFAFLCVLCGSICSAPSGATVL